MAAHRAGRRRPAEAARGAAGSDTSTSAVLRKVAEYMAGLQELSAARELAEVKQQLADMREQLAAHASANDALRAQLQV